jgi:TRAP transporter TAXI family solute receptor
MELPELPIAADRQLDRRRLLRSATGAALTGIVGQVIGGAESRRAAAQEETRFFRIGTGPTSGDYFSIGGVIANAISNPPGSRPCDSGGSCGVPGLIAIAQTTQGSVQNIEMIANKSLESGLSQCDIAFWAYSGKGMYRNKPPLDGLRAIANLYQESLHIVVRADSKIESISDLRGKRVSVGERGAGTRATALLVLNAFGVSERKFVGQQLPIGKAAEQLRDGKIDALFVVGGPPVRALAELVQSADLRLLPVVGEQAEKLRSEHPFLTVDIVPGNVYGENAPVVTLGIGTYWLVLAELDEPLAYAITAALWHKSTRRLLDEASEIGRRIRLENALVGLPIPLHDGARRFYGAGDSPQAPSDPGE